MLWGRVHGKYAGPKGSPRARAEAASHATRGRAAGSVQTWGLCGLWSGFGFYTESSEKTSEGLGGAMLDRFMPSRALARHGMLDFCFEERKLNKKTDK